MVRFAETFVPSRAIAEKVAQEAWLGVIKGIDRFEGRSSLSTWIFRIVANIARTRGERERRTMHTVSLSQELAGTGPSVAPERFQGRTGHGVWAEPPARWSDLPDERLLTKSTFERVAAVASGLSENQRRVFVLSCARSGWRWSPTTWRAPYTPACRRQWPNILPVAHIAGSTWSRCVGRSPCRASYRPMTCPPTWSTRLPAPSPSTGVQRTEPTAPSQG